MLVSNAEGEVIASSHQQFVGLPADLIMRSRDVEWLEFPLPFDCDRLAGMVAIEQPEKTTPAVERLTSALVEVVINDVIVADWIPDKAEIKNKFVYDMLHGRLTDRDVMLREAQILGMDFSVPRSVILINAHNYIYPSGGLEALSNSAKQIRVRQRARFVIASIVGFFDLPDDTICAHIGHGEIVVLKSISHQTLKRWSDDSGHARSNAWVDLPALRRAATGLLDRLRNETHASISIGIGRYHAGADGLARSYSDASIALTIGNLYHGADRVHSIDNLGFAAFVGGTDERTKRDLAEHLLDPLRDEPDLMDSLNAYFEAGCCPADTVSRLGIHRNTLRSRLQKIATLVGLDPQNFDDAIQLRLASLITTLPVR